MKDLMKAVVWDGGEIPVCRMEPIPVPREGEVLLKVLRAGICGSDISILGGKHPRAKAPLIMGHEISAEILEFGPGTTSPDEPLLTIGSLVTLEPIISCGKCVACKSGFPHVCTTLKLYGIDQAGGMAEYMTASIEHIRPVIKGIDPELVVLAEPLAVAIHAVRTAGIKYGDSVCVLGGGPIGLLIALVTEETTTKTIILSETQETRRKVAESMGFLAVDPIETPLETLSGKLTKGRGFDICFESAGSQAAINTSTKVLRPRGMLIQVSMPKDQRIFNIVDLTFKELIVKGVRVYSAFDFEKAIDLLAESPEKFKPFITKLYDLEQVSEAFNAAKSGNEGLRTVFRIA